MKFLMLFLAIVVMFSLSIIPTYASHDDRESRGSDDPRIVSVGDTAYIAWQESTDPHFWDVHFAKITGGILQEPLNLTNGTSYYPDIQIEVSGSNVYILWEDRQNPEGDDAVFFTKSNDSGKTFDEPRILAPKQGDSTIYRMMGMETSGDSLYVLAKNWNRETQKSSIVYYTSIDFGNTFSDAILLFNHEQHDQEIILEKYNDTIYILSDDRVDYDEKGSLYLRKILSDGTLTDIVNVNGGTTTVTHPQFAVHDGNVYVSWRERVFEKTGNGIHERWYQAFTKSHDDGNSFDEPILLESDPKSIDIVGAQGDFVFADNDSVYVFFRSEYWDGENQTFKIHMAYSDNLGKDFEVSVHPMNDYIAEYGALMSFYEDRLYTMALTVKNPPQNNAAVYFASDPDYHDPVDIFSGISVQSGRPDVSIDQNHIHFVADTRSNHNCILYSHSDDYGKSFSRIINISPNGNDFECLGVLPETTAPMQQSRQGASIQDIQCSQDISKGYILVLRATNQNPACITADSYVKLKDRGWVLQNYAETIAIHTARDFVESSPTFLFDGIKDTLKLDVLHARKSIPPVVTITGEFQSLNPGYGNRSGQEFTNSQNPVTHEIKLVIAQNNMVHSAIMDDMWNMITQDSVDKPKPENARGISSSPTVSTTLTVKDPVDSRGLLPIVVTEKSENVNDSITFWQFQIMGHNADDKYEEWDVLPKDKRIGWIFSSEDGSTDVWDNSKIPRGRFGIPADLHGYTMFCDGKRVQGESGHPSGIPIKSEFDTIYAKSGSKAILPNSDGIYSIEFATLFETVVELPNNAEIVENKTILCIMEEPREEATHGYYTNLVFKFNGDSET